MQTITPANTNRVVTTMNNLPPFGEIVESFEHITSGPELGVLCSESGRAVGIIQNTWSKALDRYLCVNWRSTKYVRILDDETHGYQYILITRVDLYIPA